MFVAGGAAGGASPQGPLDVRDGAEERSVHQDRVPQQLLEFVVAFGEVGQAGAQVLDQRQEQFGIQDAIGIRERAAAQALDREVILHPLRGRGVLEGSQAAQDGVEERQQVGGEQVVVMEPAVGVDVGLAQLAEVFVEQREIVRADQRRRHLRRRRVHGVGRICGFDRRGRGIGAVTATHKRQ